MRAMILKRLGEVANVARRDVREFLDLAAELRIKPEVREYALEEANQALIDLKTQSVRGAKALRRVKRYIAWLVDHVPMGITIRPPSAS